MRFAEQSRLLFHYSLQLVVFSYMKINQTKTSYIFRSANRAQFCFFPLKHLTLLCEKDCWHSLLSCRLNTFKFNAHRLRLSNSKHELFYTECIWKSFLSGSKKLKKHIASIKWQINLSYSDLISKVCFQLILTPKSLVFIVVNKNSYSPLLTLFAHPSAMYKRTPTV